MPGLAGKPVLDVAVAVASEADADACVAPLAALGYAYRGPHGDDPRRRYHVLDEAGVRVAQLHLYVLPAAAWDDKLAFRDALRADPTLARAYEAEKWRVAAAVGWDKGAYAVAKGPFVERVVSWRRQSHPAREGRRMTDAANRQFPTLAYLLGGVSVLLLAVQLWVMAQWSAAFDAGATQAERVALFHESLPLGLGVMSTTGFTLCCAALGAVGVAAALVAARGIAGVGRALCLGLGALNALLVLWYLFTLM